MPDQVLSFLMLFGFPLFLILIQWAYITLRQPWLGWLYSLLIILVVVITSFLFSKIPPNCKLLVNCSYDGLGLFFIDGESFLGLILSTAAGFLIKFYL